MGIHGCYSKDMLLLWENRGEALTISKVKINDKRQNLKSNSKLCNDGSEFKWNNFVPRWRFEPKLCLMDPIWKTNHHNILNGIYVGREKEEKSGAALVLQGRYWLLLVYSVIIVELCELSEFR